MANNPKPDKAAAWIKAKAQSHGFDICQITSATLPEEIAERLAHFTDAGYHGEMAWLAETQDRRSAPNAMWSQARSAIVLAMNYGPDHNPLESLAHKSAGNISVYARGRDYHEVIKGKLKQLAGQLSAHLGTQVKVFVDTAPLMEKPLAGKAGVGWQGKHTNLVNRDYGSWLFLGVILTTALLPSDQEETDHCGTCRSCLDICPTNAFPAPYQLDASRCISYMTIEQKSQIAPEFREAIGNRIFGCDDCLAVCPWNKFAKQASEQKFHPRHDPALMPLSALLALDEPAFRSHFANMPVRRAGYERFLRNVLIAAGNSGDEALIPAVKAHLTHELILVRSMAVWAVSRLVSPDQLAALYRSDKDEIVEAEWKRALALC